MGARGAKPKICSYHTHTQPHTAMHTHTHTPIHAQQNALIGLEREPTADMANTFFKALTNKDIPGQRQPIF